MTDSSVAEVLRELLSMYEGVRVARVRCGPHGYVSAIFHVEQPALLNRFASFAENANAGLLVWSNSEVKGSEGETPWFEWRVNPQAAESEPSPAPLYLCAYMIRDLTERGVLDQPEGDRLLAKVGWDA